MISIMFFILYGVHAQESTPGTKVIPDARLYECFDSLFIETQLTDNPDIILYYNYFLDHSYYLTDLPPKEDFIATLKSIDFPDDEDLTNLNVLKYKLELSNDKITYYRLGTSDRVIVFYEGNEITRRFNGYMVSIGRYEPKNDNQEPGIKK